MRCAPFCDLAHNIAMVLLLPKGSYQDSCYGCKYDGSDLKCTCLYGSQGAYRNSSLPNAGLCRPDKGTTVANIDGRLKCEGIPCAVGDGVANSSGMCEVQRSDVRNFFNGTTPAAKTHPITRCRSRGLTPSRHIRGCSISQPRQKTSLNCTCCVVHTRKACRVRVER